MLETHALRCPYCGEPIEVVVDVSAGDQRYIEDCSVCCRPIDFILYTDGVDWQLEARREGD